MASDVTSEVAFPVSQISASSPQPDTTLEMKGAWNNTPDFAIASKAVHVYNCIAVRLKQLGRARPASAFTDLRPPGDLETAPQSSQSSVAGGRDVRLNSSSALSRATTPKMGSNETLHALPQLPRTEINEAERYFQCQTIAINPDPKPKRKNPVLNNQLGLVDESGSDEAAFGDKLISDNRLHSLSPGVEDAFHSTIGSDNTDLLPDCVRNSSLLNTYIDYEPNQAKGVKLTPGQRTTEAVNQLADPSSGFVAGITYHPKNREVVISFPGAKSGGMQIRRTLSAVFCWLGFVPKSMSQACLLTKSVKDHIKRLNARLPPDQQIKLTLVGHSLGGCHASYAALRNKVSAVVFNPFRMGLGARARCQKQVLAEAEKYLTEIVVEGDWVADNSLSMLYLIPPFTVLSTRGPLGNARRFMLPRNGVEDPHNDVGGVLSKLRSRDFDLATRLPRSKSALRKASPRAHGKILSGDLRPAVTETVGAAINATLEDIFLTSDQKCRLNAMVGQLPDLVQRCCFESREGVKQARKDLQDSSTAVNTERQKVDGASKRLEKAKQRLEKAKRSPTDVNPAARKNQSRLTKAENGVKSAERELQSAQRSLAQAEQVSQQAKAAFQAAQDQTKTKRQELQVTIDGIRQILIPSPKLLDDLEQDLLRSLPKPRPQVVAKKVEQVLGVEAAS